MKIQTVLTWMLFVFLLIANALLSTACSMYKVTMSGNTKVGTNFDAYYLTPRIWFENSGKFGAVFSGGRFDGSNGFAPQSGMNNQGLTFSRLAAPSPTTEMQIRKNKIQITNPTQYLKDILHNCKTVEEVRDYIDQYDHGFFYQDVFIYVEQSGRYLVVEPIVMSLGDEPNYVLANFCPSTIQDFGEIQQLRYRNGVEFLNRHMEMSPELCRNLSDTMHVCRKKMGDGTLLTAISDLEKGEVTYYFYHNFEQAVTFNLEEELMKGDHMLEVPLLFPTNQEFERLCNYKTPRNSTFVQSFLFGCSAFFFLSSIFFLVNAIRNWKKSKYSFVKLMMSFLGACLTYYSFILIVSENMFFFPAPYQDYVFSHLNIAAYIPFLVVFTLLFFISIAVKIWKEHVWSRLTKGLFLMNNLLCLILVGFYFYWGFYDVL